MGTEQVPIIRTEPAIEKKNESEVEALEAREIKPSPTPPASIAGKLVKAVVYSALDWIANGRTRDESRISRYKDADPGHEADLQSAGARGIGRNKQNSSNFYRKSNSSNGCRGQRGKQMQRRNRSWKKRNGRF